MRGGGCKRSKFQEAETLAEGPKGRPRAIFKKRENNRGRGKTFAIKNEQIHGRTKACELQLV